MTDATETLTRTVIFLTYRLGSTKRQVVPARVISLAPKPPDLDIYIYLHSVTQIRPLRTRIPPPNSPFSAPLVGARGHITYPRFASDLLDDSSFDISIGYEQYRVPLIFAYDLMNYCDENHGKGNA